MHIKIVIAQSSLSCKDPPFFFDYRMFSNKRRASNKRRRLKNAAPLGIYIEISASPLIRAAPINAALIRIVTIFH